MHLPILLLENNADGRELLVEVLSDNGAFAIHAATTLDEAQALVVERGDSFAAAVLDISLLDGDGRRFCAALRRQGFHQPVILKGDLSTENDVVFGLEAGDGRLVGQAVQHCRAAGARCRQTAARSATQ